MRQEGIDRDTRYREPRLLALLNNSDRVDNVRGLNSTDRRSNAREILSAHSLYWFDLLKDSGNVGARPAKGHICLEIRTEHLTQLVPEHSRSTKYQNATHG